MVKGKFKFLGTGASSGVPVIGCTCAVCLSSDPKNKRLRVSAQVLLEGKRLLIDAGPDFRTQALNHGIDHVDGILITHTHYDHIAGIDDLRPIYFKQGQIPCLLSKASFLDMKARFHYLMHPLEDDNTECKRFKFNVLEMDSGQAEFLGFKIGYTSYAQAGMQVTGFRFGSLAYITDIREYDDSIFESLKGVDTLVLSALRFTPSDVHFSVDEALDFIKKVGASKAFLTHISHSLEHSMQEKLPKHVQFGYDGLEISFEYGV